MTTPNHIAGGLVFTGTMLSFYNQNIFSSPFYVGACVAFSLIPDIDTPQTIPGKAVYPFAVAINRRFGHRTITHSLLFLAILTLFWTFLSRFIGLDSIYTKILLFAFISHLILDMITIQGVPLFYPFRRNPCVLPADPAYRFTTNNARSETILFTILILLAFTMFPLFTQGFWTSYNRQFGTLAHCDRENTNANTWIVCEYEFIKNNETKKGEAIILSSNEKKLELFNQKEVFEISTDDKTIKLITTRPKNTSIPKRFQELNFMNIPLDSVNNLMNKKVCTGLIQSNQNVKYMDKGITYHTNFIKFANSYNFKVLTVIDSTKNELLQKIQSVNARIEKDSLDQLTKYSDYNILKSKQIRLSKYISSVPDSNLYLKNKYQNELIEVSNKIKSFELRNFSINIVLLRERESLLNQLKNENSVLFSGYLTYCIFE